MKHVLHPRFTPCALLLMGAILIVAQANSQFLQQGGKLTGTGAVGTLVYQGMSVAISADGSTALVGATRDNGSIGATWVFVRNGSVWTQQGSKLVGSGASGTVVYQGGSLSLSADGNTAIVGGWGDNNNMGAAWVFVRNGTTWSQQSPKLVGTGVVGAFANQGASVALSADGNTAIVGGYADNSYKGAAWVFTRSGGVWTQQGSKLVGSAGTATSTQGLVAISADGNTAAVGGNGDAGGTGAVWVFTRSGGVWTQQGSKLVGTGAVGTANQGGAVSISSDGNTLLSGGFADNAYAGAVWVFTRSGSVWSQQGSKLVGTGAVGIAEQGWSVSLSGDGNTAIVGGDRDNGYAGASWVFARSGGVWTQQGTKLVGTGAVGTSVQQGKSVSVSSDGRRVIIGGPIDNNGPGAAWMFYNSTTDVGETRGYPTEFQLKQNYPNPFNPSTTVSFSIPTRAFVSLRIVDPLGKEVSVLMSEEAPAGEYIRVWNAIGHASGVYFCRLRAGSFLATRKLVLLR
jgi:hypothetical protein